MNTYVFALVIYTVVCGLYKTAYAETTLKHLDV